MTAAAVAAVGTRAPLGVAPEATLLPVKVLDATNTGRVTLVVGGLRWAVSRDCDGANLSISGAASRAVDDAVRFAANRGTVAVASAGNVGPCENCVNPLAAHPEVVAVTAATRDDGLAPFSATGPEAELAAPGLAIPTTGTEGYVTLDGTSFSTPHPAGAVALCRGSGRSAPTSRELLVGTASPLDLDATAAGRDLVDAESSLVHAVRTRDPAVDRRAVALRGALPRLEADARTDGSASGGGRGAAGGRRRSSVGRRAASSTRPCGCGAASATPSGRTPASPTAGGSSAAGCGSGSPSRGRVDARGPVRRR